MSDPWPWMPVITLRTRCGCSRTISTPWGREEGLRDRVDVALTTRAVFQPTAALETAETVVSRRTFALYNFGYRHPFTGAYERFPIYEEVE